MYYYKTKQKKIFLIILLLTSGLLILFLYQKEIVKQEKEILCLNFSLNEKVCLEEDVLFYDQSNNIYYFPIDKKYQDREYYFSLKTEKADKNHYINNELIDNKKFKINYQDMVNYQTYNKNNEVSNINIKYTNLPIVNILLDGNITDDNKKADFNIIGLYGSEERDLYTKKITIKKRGNTSRAFDKSAYRIEFGKSKKDIIIEDNSVLTENEDWALDALYTDTSKIRNKLSTDIWNYINQISNKNPEINVFYIELYLNNEYKGLYTLKDIITRKKLKLNKSSLTDSSILLKGINYLPIDWQEKDFDNIKTARYHSLEMKYPNQLLYYSKYWTIALNKLAGYYQSGENIYDNINTTFNVNNFLDYKIFIELIAAGDNYSIKNTLFSMENKDSKISLTPWDMDLTFGLYYTKYETLLSEKIPDYVNYDMDYHNFIGDEKYLNALKERYYYLRQNGLNKDYFFNLIDEYVENIYYASIRDSERWYEYDIIKETKEIKDWISKRFGFLDTKFKEL